jgi:hypothetical protein
MDFNSPTISSFNNGRNPATILNCDSSPVFPSDENPASRLPLFSLVSSDHEKLFFASAFPDLPEISCQQYFSDDATVTPELP